MSRFLRIGFTGTRRGMTEHQKFQLCTFLKRYRGVFIHGDCKGADAEAHFIAHEMGYLITVYPSTLEAQRAFVEGANIVHSPFPPLLRNHRIVDDSDVMVACPREAEEQQRSGTWATTRYTRKRLVPLLLIPPEAA